MSSSSSVVWALGDLFAWVLRWILILTAVVILLSPVVATPIAGILWWAGLITMQQFVVVLGVVVSVLTLFGGIES